MKKWVFAVIFICSGVVRAAAQTEPDFDFFKSEAISHIDQRMMGLATAKACIEAAADKPALKECQKALNEERRDMKMKKKGTK